MTKIQTPKSPVTLTDVQDALVKRLHAVPVKVKRSEIRNRVLCTAHVLRFKSTFPTLKMSQVLNAVKGLREQRPIHKVSGEGFTHSACWSHRSSVIKFHLFFRRMTDHSCVFMLRLD